MSDLKLFKIAGTVAELSGGAVALERSLQLLFEKNLEALLGVRFLASEFVTEGGRMDTIGMDENQESSAKRGHVLFLEKVRVPPSEDRL